MLADAIELRNICEEDLEKSAHSIQFMEPKLRLWVIFSSTQLASERPCTPLWLPGTTAPSWKMADKLVVTVSCGSVKWSTSRIQGDSDYK
ncbi:hypothetical protein RB195_017192 [Necator americanus]|uniref:Uncharacterized protein n=1 Tax=Necator americanus TaxID=51031 RepID=A0ABR1C435_NECAM